MTNEMDHRVLGRKGARMLSDQEVLMVTGAKGTILVTHLPNGLADVLADT